MTMDRCEDMKLLLQADFDGELDAAAAAPVAAHLASCPDCTATQAELAALSSRLRTEVTYHPAPPALRRALEAMANAATIPPRPAPPRWRRVVAGWRASVLPFGGGAGLGLAVAAVLALVLLPRDGDPADRVIASHIRALQPGHLMDVISTDQHTVKPWFDGRLDYAPPVKDLASHGFPLVGGRLDYLVLRPVAALAYRRALHVIDLYVWPTEAGAQIPPGRGSHSGYNTVRWTQDGMEFWAVSDLNAAELGEFVDLWRAAS